VFLFICIFLVGSLYFVKTSLMTMILSAIYLTLMGICATTIIGMSVVIFPTLMRFVSFLYKHSINIYVNFNHQDNGAAADHDFWKTRLCEWQPASTYFHAT